MQPPAREQNWPNMLTPAAVEPLAPGHPDIARALTSLPPIALVPAATKPATISYKPMILGGNVIIPHKELASALEDNSLEISCSGDLDNQENGIYSCCFRSTKKLISSTGPRLAQTTKCRAALHSILASMYILLEVEESTGITGTVQVKCSNKEI